MKSYLDVLEDVATNGKVKGNRTGVGTKYLFSKNFRHDLRDGFPLLTTKKINPLRVVGELFAFLRGATTVQEFEALGSNIWEPWGLEEDHYRLVKVKAEDYAQLVADKLNLSKEQGMDKIRDVEEVFAKWQTQYNEHVTAISSGQLQDPEEITKITNDLLLKQPQMVLQYLKSLDIPLFVKDIIYEKGYLGPIYGEQWLNWKTSTGESVNQLKRLADQLEYFPSSRRIVLTAWNPEVIPADKYVTVGDKARPVLNSSDGVQAAILDGKQALPPCHLLVILDVDRDDDAMESVLNMHVIMRSTDVPVGLPFNIASYAFLMKIIAKQYGMVAGVLSIDMTNCHIYDDQLELAKVQLARTPKALPTVEIPDGIDFDRPETLTRAKVDEIIAGIQNYEHDAFIKYPVAV